MTQPVWELLPWIAGLLILLAVLRTAEAAPEADRACERNGVLS